MLEVGIVGFFLLTLNGYFYLCGIQSHGYKIKESLSGVTVLLIMDSISVVTSIALSLSLELSGFDMANALCLITMAPSLIAGIVKIVRYFGLSATFTRRMIRLTVSYEVICAILSVIACLVCAFTTVYGIVVSMSVVIAFLVLSALSPFEKRNNLRYIRIAKSKLAERKITVIGVTGSAGKTSVKQMLSVLLSPLGNVYATPKSYNTPMGIARSILEMPDRVDIFIAEYGARNKGDIDELLNVVYPDVAVLTAVAPQHLETFGSIENVFNEKVKLLKASERSFANEKCKWAGRDFPANTEFFGESNYVNKIISCDNTYLSLVYGEQKISSTTSLLGSVNADNLVLAIGVALALGVSVDDVCYLLPRLTAVPHRTERTITRSGITVIDDSFNINPTGALSSLELLNTATGRKIVTFSGFVEQGKNDAEATKLICDKICEFADILIVLGNKNKKKIIGNVDGNIEYYFAKNIDDCKKLYSEILQKGDTLLILADIPKYYEL